MNIQVNIDEVPVKVVNECRNKGISDEDITTIYEDILQLAIQEGRSTQFEDGDVIDHIVSVVEMY